MTNHVSSFVVAGPERSNPHPRRATAVLPSYRIHCDADSPLSGYFGCLKKEELQLRDGKGRPAPGGWMQAEREFIFLLWPLQFYEANGWK